MPDLVERLRLEVDATTSGAEAKFSKLSTEADGTAKSAKTSGAEVAAAADRVAQARLKESDAAGALRVAEARLQELRDSGRAKASQLVAAEERVATAQRQLTTATRATTSATEAQAVVQARASASFQQTGTEAELAGRRASAAGTSMTGSLRSVGGAILAAGIVTGFRSVTDAAEESARITARTENVIRTTGQAAGLTADQVGDLAGAIAAKTGVDDEAIQSGANLLLTFTNIRDAAGEGNDVFSQATELMTDMSAAMGTDASASALQLGKALNDPIRGISALSRAGVSFTEEQKEQIRTLVESGDVLGAQKIILGELSKEFGGAAEAMSTPMDRARVAVGNVAEGIGSILLPVVGVAADGINLLAGAAGAVPAPLTAAAAAAVAWGFAQRSASTEGSFLNTALGNVQGAAGRFTGAVEAARTRSGALGTAMAGARVAGGGLVNMLGGPLGVAVLGLGAGFSLLNALTGENATQSEAAQRAQQSLAQALAQSNGVITDNVRQQAAQAAETAGVLETTQAAGIAAGDVTDAILGQGDALDRVVSALNDYSAAQTYSDGTYNDAGQAARDAIGWLDDQAESTGNSTEATQRLSQELQNATDKQSLAQAATEALTDAIDAGNVPIEELTRLAGEAARAQDAAAAADNRAQAAMDAYRATTSLAVQATMEWINARYASENSNFAFLNAMDAAAKATDDATTSVDEYRQAQVGVITAALSAGNAAADAAVQAAEAAGTVVDDVTEAQIRADAMLADLRGKLNTPGLTQGARDEMQGLIDQLQTAKDRGDIQAVLSLTGAPEVQGQIETATEDQDTTVHIASAGGPAVIAYIGGIAAGPYLATVRVESRNGPAVIAYLAGIATADRLAIVRVESRNGPAVLEYLRSIERGPYLALIRVESRNGPAVDTYLDGLAHERLAIIRVETRGGPAVDAYLDGLANQTRVARIQAQQTGAAPAGAPVGIMRGTPAGLMTAGAGSGAVVDLNRVSLDLQLVGQLDRSQLSKAEKGRIRVEEIRAYEKVNGDNWRTGPRR